MTGTPDGDKEKGERQRTAADHAQEKVETTHQAEVQRQTEAAQSAACPQYVEPDDVGEERARELYHYYRPPTSKKGEVVFLPFADTVLQAHCQLAACRLNVQRGMICLVDQDTQFFLAEATKSTYGSINTPKRGGLVEWTLSQKDHEEDGEQTPAHFEVLDLPEDPRWKHKQYIATPPYFRYYCGVPLRTDNGINIGVLFVMDTSVPKIRESMSPRHLKLLSSCAKNIMIHLQTVKEAHEKQRAVNFNMCLADFISPKDRFRKKANIHSTLQPPRLSPNRPAYTSADDLLTPAETTKAFPDSSPSPHGHASGNSAVPGKGERERGRSRFVSGDEDPRASHSSANHAKESVTDADHQNAFDRAVALIRQSLDLSLGGGVVLLDTSASANVDGDSQSPSARRTTSEDTYLHVKPDQPRKASSEDLPTRSPDRPRAIAAAIRRAAADRSMEARVLLAAASIVSPNRAPITYGRADSSFKTRILPCELLVMCKKYGRGKLFSVPDYVPAQSYDSEGRSVANAMSATLWYLTVLRRQFPDAKQVIFVPMFHVHLNRWTACFAYTTSPYRVLTYETDYLHTLSFCNAIRAEVLRMATEYADQQKNVFIGSVSHELRSPLHGLLAAIEFLQDTECSSFQTLCLDTADACAHTLLDSITMVLDQSKRYQGKSSPKDSERRAPSRMDVTQGQQKKPQLDKHESDSLLSTNTICDLALITEEVVEGVAMAHLFRDRSNVSVDSPTPERDSSSTDQGFRPALARLLSVTTPPEVELVLDIQSLSNWEFITQPGAFRRIVMNLFTNALKYTRRGYISVSLSVAKDRSTVHEEPCMLKLTVRDTGQGISPEFLRTKLFTPFAQENAKAMGSGLGLSIVRTLVDTLRGQIEVKSVLNLGTIFIVMLPMRRASAGMPVGDASHQRPKDASVTTLRTMPYRPQIASYGPAPEDEGFGQTQGVMAVYKTTLQYLTGWYLLPAAQTWSFNGPAQLLIMDEIHLPNLLGQRPDFLETLHNQSLIVLCANPRRQADIEKDMRSKKVELLCKPVGPYKLARALIRALERAATSDTRTEIVGLPKKVAGSPIAPLTAIPAQTYIARNESVVRTSLSPSGESREKQSGTGTPRPVPGQWEPVETKSSETHSHASPPPVLASIQLPTKLPPHLSPVPSMSIHPSRPSASTEHSSSYPYTKIEQKRSSSQPTSSAGAEAMTRKPECMQSRKPRLLLVDDNKINLQLLHSFAKKQGYGPHIIDAEDGLQAVESFKASSVQGTPPDVIFMDISMPIMDGYEATRRIRRDEEDRRRSRSQCGVTGPSDTKPALVVALTGNTGGKDRSEAFDAGVDIYMTKPVSMKEVGKLLENWRE